MTSRLLSLSLLIWLTLVLSVGSASAERRVALIIGNSNYKNVQLLANPARDATAVGALFKKAGFEVVESKLDLGNTAMRRTIREFTSGHAVGELTGKMQREIDDLRTKVTTLETLLRGTVAALPVKGRRNAA